MCVCVDCHKKDDERFHFVGFISVFVCIPTSHFLQMLGFNISIPFRLSTTHLTSDVFLYMRIVQIYSVFKFFIFLPFACISWKVVSLILLCCVLCTVFLPLRCILFFIFVHSIQVNLKARIIYINLLFVAYQPCTNWMPLQWIVSTDCSMLPYTHDPCMQRHHCTPYIR